MAEFSLVPGWATEGICGCKKPDHGRTHGHTHSLRESEREGKRERESESERDRARAGEQETKRAGQVNVALPAFPPAPFFLRPAPDQMSNKNSAKKVP